MTDRHLTGDELARACVAAMYARDVASQTIGITVTEVREGFARLNLTIKPDMLNGHGICHGGYIFTLADTAFACACNSRNEANLAQKCTIEYKRPGKAGDNLTATAEHQSQDGRYGHYQVQVTNQENKLIALFEGQSCRVRG
ncbi:MAG: hydroxyphenylacetyl-CoA thioesterase PaaI, partial [Gammaproteobacteria bacterium]|nr:hydroxyphenylacetyl-CoA thioesterase PaaI [Gammaproteobacteria bacterium]MCY4338259.1 hydroxyphenylacetyl-CoA thioesterase PaaI [Gammaproteobacteria bacterium]